MKSHLAIFDFDGTLFDTIYANHAAYEEALRPYGVALSYEHFAQHCNGRYYKDFLGELLGADTEAIEAVHRAKLACFPRYFDQIRENTALFSLLEAIAPRYHIALVSTAAAAGINAVLDRFGRREAFELILTQEQVQRKKPAPDGFLMAMEHFHVPAQRTIIFEDSPEGIAAARACGAQCFVVQEIR